MTCFIPSSRSIAQAQGLAVALVVSLAVGAPAAAETFNADHVVIDRHIGRIEIITSPSATQIDVEIDPGAGIIDAPTVRLSGGAVRIEAARRFRSTSCRSRRNNVRFRVGSGGYHPVDDYPSVRITAPESLVLEISHGLVIGEAGNVAVANVSLNGCGDFALANIAGDAWLSVDGSGDIVAGDIGGEAELSVDGSGDIFVLATGPARASIDGSGDIRLASVDGDLVADIDGSGDIRVGPVSGGLTAGVDGSGDIVIGPVSGGLIAGVNGSGDIRVDQIDGPFEADIDGSGDIAVDKGRASSFEARINGSGDIRFGGEAVDPRVWINGSGGVRLGSVQGSVTSHGRHHIQIGH